MSKRSIIETPSLRALLKESTFDAYESIADEYDEDSHQTCRDFDEMTRRLLISKLDMVMRAGTILDLGGGTGVVPSILKEITPLQGKHIHAVDQSDRMLKVYRQKHNDLSITFEQTTATQIRPNKPYDLVIATLCDPFLTNQFLESLPALIEQGGSFILSFPHEKWAKLVRKPEELTITRFRDRNGYEHIARSICRDPTEVQEHLQCIGLIEVDYQIHSYAVNESTRSELTRNALERKQLSSIPFYAGVSGRKKP